MARAPTDGVGIAAWAAPWPPRALVNPLAPQLCLVTAVVEEEWQSPFPMAVRRQMALVLRRGQPLHPPRALIVPLAPLLCLIVAFAEEEVICLLL